MDATSSDYDTFRDLYLDNPQKVAQIIGYCVGLGMSPEKAKADMEAYVASQKHEGSVQ